VHGVNTDIARVCVALEDDNFVNFDFLGKDSIRYENHVQVEHQVWKNLKRFKKEPKVDGDPLFDRLNVRTAGGVY
jgi:DNA topoisomerase-1